MIVQVFLPAEHLCSMLNMRTAAGPDDAVSVEGARLPSDLTARARIRDAAIDAFAAEGFRASVRTIAAAAGVSPALVTHHFGTKHALREDCDAEVLRRYRALKSEAIAEPSSYLLRMLGDVGTGGPVLVYLLRSIQAGGAVGRDFLAHVMDDARGYLADAVAAGVVRPSRDEEARLRYLTYQTLGALLIEFLLNPDADVATIVREVQETTILPTLELFTEGILTDRSMLDAYLSYRNDATNRQHD